jgi:hypothetical protein
MKQRLKQMQYLKSDADNQYFSAVSTHLSYLREHHFGMTHINKDISKDEITLQQLFDSCTSARGDYGPLEDDCIMAENDLGIREYELQSLEMKLYERLDHQAYEVNAHGVGSRPFSSESSYSEADSEISEASDDYDPLVAEYLSKLGDVHILHERLEAHMEEWELLEENKDMKRRVNLDLPEDDLEWLEMAPQVEIGLLDEIEAAEDEVEKLKMKCISLNLINQDGEVLDFEARERLAFSSELDAKSEISEYRKFPTLIPHHPSKKTQIFDSTLKQNEKSYDPVGPWLLQITRMSPLAISLLATIFEQQSGRKAEGKGWQIAVLKFWFSDRKWKQTSGSTITSSGVVTDSPLTSKFPGSILSRSRDFESYWPADFPPNAQPSLEVGYPKTKLGIGIKISISIQRRHANSI